MANLVEYVNEGTEGTVGSTKSEAEEKRESLAILASLGTTKEYIGIEATLGDIKKFSVKDVEKYYNRYQAVLGKQVTCGLVESSIKLVTKVISYVLPIDDSEKLFKDLNNDELVKRELSSFAGLLALKGGRFVALASGIFQVAKHITLGSQEPASRCTQEYPNKTPSVPSEATKHVLSNVEKHVPENLEGASEAGYDTIF